MTQKNEVLFVDPGVADIATLLGGLRPEVEPIMLDTARPVARQVAAALAGRRCLDAVHIVAHGAPGRVSFAAGEWSAETVGEQAPDFTAIGEALGEGGGLRLWSCFARPAAATGRAVVAAEGLTGATKHYGSSQLNASYGDPALLETSGAAASTAMLPADGMSSTGASVSIPPIGLGPVRI